MENKRKQKLITPEKLAEAGYRTWQGTLAHIGAGPDLFYQKPVADGNVVRYYININEYDYTKYSQLGHIALGAQMHLSTSRGGVTIELSLSDDATIESVEEWCEHVFVALGAKPYDEE